MFDGSCGAILLDRRQVRFDCAKRVRGRVPAIAFAAEQGVGVKPSFVCEPALGKAGRLECAAKALDEVCNHAGNKSISPYALQAQKHTSMCAPRYMHRRMERTPDERRAILRGFIIEKELKIARWAKLAGVDKNSIYNFLNEHSLSLDPRTYAKLARAAEVPLHRLTGEMPEPPSPTAIWVVGHVQAGSFNEAVEWDRSRWYPVDVPIPDRFRRVAKALEVRGNSMNLEYKPGAIVIWVDMLDYRPPRHEDHVVVYSERMDGQIEATIKEYRVDANSKRWLWPRSDDPEHQLPLDLDNPPEGVCNITVKGIVIGDYRQRAH
jgi:SOS-response transcriptional repressor LexA